MTAYEKFSKSIHNFGRLSMVLGMIAVLLPPMLMTFYFGFNPGITAIITGAISQISVSGAFYFSEPIANYPIVGAAGLYMSILSGNSVNLKIPAAVSAIAGSGYKQGTDEGSMMGTMGIAVSIYVATFFVIVSTIFAQTVIVNLPENIKEVLTLIIPALYGGIFAQFSVKSFKTGIFALVIAFVMSKIVALIPFNATFLITLVTVFSSIFFARTQLETINKNS
ncbi:hypothetical protein KQI68_00125 [Peptoniphilus sp. MSJ-1]|uniref:Uncharacterized protein n=1 Tax=Peptoniphilus ovalis TaxID=2841503 RepID=A0ABS6FG46_9FIRM|nr:hypothetical protein [Peptoniphilus ovalis]MBU5668236.1 hypothetical protein [Peptoniphilus ovalis]